MTAIKTSLKASLIATAIATFPLGAHAAGLGTLNVFSGLGQPLRAEIELNATPHELESLTAKVASAEAFRQANLPYSPAMSALRLAVERRGGRAVVRISSDRPLNEPFVDLLLELDWASGRLIREYTFLLDPVPLNAPAPVAAQVDVPSASAAPAERGRPAGAAAAAAPASAKAPPERYEVRRGDTLHRVAEAHRPETANLDQMLIALFRDNPDAFDAGNINRLRAGAILNVPAEPEVLAVEPAQARREVVAHSADFDAYRKRLAGAVATRPSSEAPATQSDAGTIVPRVDEPATEGATGDRVKVSAASDPAAQPASGDSARLARLQALEEELVARDKALEEANSRLAALEASIREMQQLLVLRNQSLGELQRQAEPAPRADAAPAAASPDETEATERAQVAANAERTAERTPAAGQAPEPVEQPGFLDDLLRDPKMLAGGGGILVLLLGYAGLKARRRNHADADFGDRPEVGGDLPLVTNSVFGATGGQNVNTGDTSIIHTDFSQSGLSAIDTDEGVDPVAEADVYMAYGRDAQAEEILLDALKSDTSRPAIFLKLLEIYEQRKNVKQFESVATDFYSRTGGEGGDWQRAAEMGRRIDPANPLYGAAGASLAAATTEAGIPRAESSPPAAGSSGIPAAVVSATAAAAASEAVSDEGTKPEALDGLRPDLEFDTLSMGEPTLSEQRDATPAPAAPVEGDALGLDFPEVAARDDVPAIDPLIEALPEIDSAALDFDLDAGLGLDGELTEPVETGATSSAESAVPQAESNDEISFDLDTEPEAGAAPVEDAFMSATVVGDGTEFALPELGGEFDAPEVSAEAQPEATFDAFDLPAETVEDNAATSDADLEKTTFDSSLLDFDFNLDDPAPEAPEAADAAPMFDLSSIDLNLEPSVETGPELSGDLAEATDIRGGLPHSAAAELNEEALQEVDTKLELARAYDEMGDKDGARELIEEVLREGSPEQQAAGRRLLGQLV